MISIIIPTLNEEEYLPKLLESISNQTYRDYEVIVADAGSTDRTKKIAKKYGARVVKGGMPGPGRNRGAAAAKGAFLFFFDADVKLPRRCLEYAYKEMQKRYLDLATCEFLPLSNMKIDKALHDFANISIKLAQYSSPHAPGFCIFVTKRLFERVGGFDEHVKLAEDHDFVKRASKFRPLRVLEKARIQVSVRRLRKEGRIMLVGKYVHAEMYRIFKGELKKEVIKYEFSSFDEKKKDKLAERLFLIEKHINKIGRDYDRLKKKFSNR